MIKKKSYSLVILMLIFSSTFAYFHVHVSRPHPHISVSDGLKKLKKIIANPPVPAPVKKTAIAPTQIVVTTAKVATGKESVKNGVKEIRETASIPMEQTNNVLKAAITVKSAMHNYVSAHIGHVGSFVIDLGDFAEHYSLSTAATTNDYAAMVIAKGNLRYILGIPLAAAIHEANDRFSGVAQPIPPDVRKELLKKGFTTKVLDRARFAVGTLEIALPNFVGKYEKYFQHQDMAVTVDNIIVFPRNPGTTYAENCTWWAHEMTHVKQYTEMGVEAFAYSYSNDILHKKSYQNIQLESEAIANADKITNGNRCTNQLAGDLELRLKVENNLSSTKKTTDTTHYFTNILKPNENYIARVTIPSADIPGIFLITDKSRIIAVNPITGEGIAAGHAITPPLPNPKHYAWIFDLPGKQYDYGVTRDGYAESLNHK
jgi:hypothetical protein